MNKQIQITRVRGNETTKRHWLQFTFENGLFVTVSIAGLDKDSISIRLSSGYNDLLHIKDTVNAFEYCDDEGNLNVSFCMNRARAVIQLYKELHDGSIFSRIPVLTD